MIRLLVIAVAGIALAGLGITGWRAMSSAPPPPHVVQVAAPQPMVKVLVAARDLSPGTQLRPGDLSTTSITLDKAPPDAWHDTNENRATLIGALVRHQIVHDAVLNPGELLLAGDHGFLAALLTPGMRAFTIQHDEIISGADLIWPGDHIDLILTQQMPATMPPSREVSAETVLSDLRVVAIGHQLFESPPAEGKQAANQPADPGMVTVEVSPADAEKLAVALRLGRVAFAVRPATSPASGSVVAASAPAPDHHDTTWADAVMHSLDEIHPAAPPVSLHVYEGDGDKEYKF